MAERMVAVYRLSDGWVLGAMCQTTAGVWIGSGPHRRLDLSVTVSDLGRAVVDTGSLSTTGVQHPSRSEWKAVVQPLLDASGFKTWSALAQKVSAVNVTLGDDSVVVAAQRLRREGRTIWFEGADSTTVNPEADELGEAVMEAMNRSAAPRP